MNVAIIAEYNPFHNGHLYQINEIRKKFGEDACIVAIMSGNYTQRGELALADKYLRAKWAALSGVDLVLEFPFPYSMSSAEIFARAAVKIITELKCIDVLSFGSESGDIDKLTKAALNMSSTEYKRAFANVSEAERASGYPALAELAYREAFGDELSDDFFSSNNILAIEYIKAIHEFDSPMELHTIKRLASRYNEKIPNESDIQSALTIRELIKSGAENASSYIPSQMRHAFKSAYDQGEFPTSADKLSAAIISHFVLNTPESDIFDVTGGLYNRIKNASLDAENLSSLIRKTETKKFTNARIRRGILYSFFGVTSSKIKELPRFTRVLAFDRKGRALLKVIKERSDFPVVTKPSSRDALPISALSQADLLDSADFVFNLAKPIPKAPSDALRATPFVKE